MKVDPKNGTIASPVSHVSTSIGMAQRQSRTADNRLPQIGAPGVWRRRAKRSLYRIRGEGPSRLSGAHSVPFRGVFQAFQSRGRCTRCRIDGEKVQRDGDKIGSAATPDPLVESCNRVAHMENVTWDWRRRSAAEQDILRDIVLLVE